LKIFFGDIKMKNLKLTICLIVLAVVAISIGSYSVLNYVEQGGARTVIGGSLDVVSGGDLDIESGGAFKIAGTAVTLSASQLNGVKNVSTTTTTPVAVSAANTGTVYVSYGVAAGAANCVYTLPAAAAGLTYTFVDANATAADDLWLTAAAGDKINGGTAAKSFVNTGDVYGASVTVFAADATNWIAIPGTIGTWANNND
jgi:hypothetical protein